MLLQKNSDEGPVLQAIMKLAQAKKENQEVKKEPKKEDKKLPDDWDEDLERANREQEALNKQELASTYKVEVKVAEHDDCPCKSHGGCKCGGNKVVKTFKVEAQFDEAQFDDSDANRLKNNFQLGKGHGPWDGNFKTKGPSETKYKIEDALEFARKNNVSVKKVNNNYILEKDGVTQTVTGPNGIINAVMQMAGTNKSNPSTQSVSPDAEAQKLYTELGHIVMDDNNFQNGIFQWVGRAAEIKKRLSEINKTKQV